jgi:Thermophilic metalloprotease (M29)
MTAYGKKLSSDDKLMLTPQHWEGVSTLIDYYLCATKKDWVVIVFTSDTLQEMNWVRVALQDRGIPNTYVWSIPLRDPEFKKRLSSELPKSCELAGGRLILLTIENETISHDEAINSLLSQYPKDQVRLYRAMSAGGLLFSNGLRVTPEDLSKRNTSLLLDLMPARNIRFTSESGSDVRIEFESDRFRWISNRGYWKPGKVVILPAGEIATYPSSVDGCFVADFGFNANFHTLQDGRLNLSPVTLWLEKSRVVGIDCSDNEVKAFITECLAREPNSNRVGEVGFGTNFGINAPVRQNSHLNERHPGMHLGLGESNQNPKLVGYTCSTHLDLISSGGIIELEEHSNATIDLSRVAHSDKSHPIETRDEDAYGADGSGAFDSDDCCSFPVALGSSCLDIK